MKILLYVDPSFRGDWAMALAKELVRGLGGPLVLLATRENLGHDPKLLERAAKSFADTPGLVIEKKVRSGLAREAILEEARESHPAITIVPPAGRKGIQRIIKGSRVKAVVHNAPSTVMVARQPVSDHIRSILVTVSGGPMSQTTVLSAHEIAEALQARLTLLHVRSSIHIPFGEAVEAPAAVDVSKLLEEVPRGPIEPVVHVREGMVVNEILAECEEGHFDLLVLGQHLMDRATGGPLSENLAEVLVMECPIPVLVVRPRRWAAQTAAGQSGSEAPGS